MDTFEKQMKKIKKYKLKYLRLKTGKFMMEESSPPQVGDNIRLNEDNIPDEVYRNRRGVIRNIQRGNRYVIDFPDIQEVLYFLNFFQKCPYILSRVKIFIMCKIIVENCTQ